MVNGSIRNVRRTRLGGIAFGGIALGFIAFLLPASAAPLDKNACAKLAQDMQNMKLLDVDKLMEKGPSWAASHLSPAELSLVRQYIGLDEQMKFRCSAPSSLVHLKNLDEADEENGQAKEPAEGEAKKTQAGDGAENSLAGPEKHKAAKTPAKKNQLPRQGAAAQ